MLDEAASIAKETSVKEAQVRAVARLLEDGATVPFIARYRKEATGGLDEVEIAAVRDALARAAQMSKRRDAILSSLGERDLLTNELKSKLLAASTLTELEDLYLPHRPKRRTRAMIARERGLEPLADALWSGKLGQVAIAELAARLVDPAQEVASVEEAFAGARDILAERIAEDPEVRVALRGWFYKNALLTSKSVKSKEAEGARFRDWFNWSEPLARAPSHRVLALLRGANEGVLRVHALPDEEDGVAGLERRFLRGDGFVREQIRLTLVDTWRRLLAPSLENEVLKAKKEEADRDAIRVFADNVRELLMSAPMGRKRVLAVDPGFRTGCKVVVLDELGGLKHRVAIFPHTGAAKREEAAATVRRLVSELKVEAIALGNGTAGRETEQFLKELDLAVPVAMVDESGASIYSASEVAREEMPNEDITVRGAVSIGRRLQDPLSELVKIDPKSIGVGQYQHDVDQTALKAGLDDVVMSCVNGVGVEVNSASPTLLTYVAGLGPVLAKNIVQHRNEHGPFQTRSDLMSVARLGKKAFEQCAGFLRIRGAASPLDASAVHPERYGLVKAMASDVGADIAQLMRDSDLRKRIDLKRYVDAEVGEPTLRDILAELDKPGRDPRASFAAFAYGDVHEVTDLRPGMRLPGIVTNVTSFGAFVDIGVHTDGLVHVSQLSDQFVQDPSQVVRARQAVTVTVVSIDLDRRRIALSMKNRPDIQTDG